MHNNFFRWICVSIFNANQTATAYDNVASKSQAYMPLQDCECTGHDYYGMPTFYMLSNKTKASGDTDSNIYYELDPSQFELFPKVNAILRTTFCNLGLYNLN